MKYLCRVLGILLEAAGIVLAGWGLLLLASPHHPLQSWPLACRTFAGLILAIIGGRVIDAAT